MERTPDSCRENAKGAKTRSLSVHCHYAQLRGYLRAADKRVGLLLNSGDAPVTIKRLVNKY
jgi:hypothetical protein